MDVFYKPRQLENCIFCGRSGTTKEHVFPRWTHRYMEARQPGRAKRRRGLFGVGVKEMFYSYLPGELRDWQVKCVCGGDHQTCNNGWMRDVENRAKAEMIPLILGQNVRLIPKQQEAIATWAVLKSMISECDMGRRPRSRHMHRNFIMRQKHPPNNGWAVWIGCLDRFGGDMKWMSIPFRTYKNEQPLSAPDIWSTEYNSKVNTQIIGKLLIHVIHCPMRQLTDGWRFNLPDRGSMFRIWPASEFSISCPSHTLTDLDVTAVAAAVPDWLRKMTLQERSSEQKRIGAAEPEREEDT